MSPHVRVRVRVRVYVHAYVCVCMCVRGRGGGSSYHQVTGQRLDYALAPAWPSTHASDPPALRATSRSMLLNGALLELGAGGTLPPFHPAVVPAAPAGKPSVASLPPLGVLFAVFPDAAAAACT